MICFNCIKCGKQFSSKHPEKCPVCDFSTQVMGAIFYEDWFIKTRRLDIISYWMQAPDDIVEAYIKHMNLVYGSIEFGDPTIEPDKFIGLAARYERK